VADPEIRTKRCPKCGNVKSCADFGRAPSRPSGIEVYCRACMSAKGLAYRVAHKERVRANNAAYRLANLAAIKVKEAAYRTAHPDKQRTRYAKWLARNGEKQRAYLASWLATNAERYATSRRIYRRLNSKAIVARVAAWEDANPERAKASALVRSSRRRARKHAAGGKFTVSDVRDIRRMQRDRCAACRVALKGKGHLDHIVALSNGGSNDRRNLQLLCRPCNCSKNARDASEFMRSRGFLL